MNVQKFSIRVTLKTLPFTRYNTRFHEIVSGNLIRFDNTGLCAEFRSHIAKRHTFHHVEAFDSLPSILYRLITPSIHTHYCTHLEGHILGRDTYTDCPRPIDSNCMRHLDPSFPGGKNTRHVGSANAKHVSAKGAASGRVTVAANRKHAGAQVPPFRHHDVAYALLVIKVYNSVFFRPFTG